MIKIPLYGKRLVFSILPSLLIAGGVGYIFDIPLSGLLVDSFVGGILIGMGGIFLRHPILGFRISSYVRGACLGTFGGLSSILISDSWIVMLLAFLITGSLIDTLVTRYTGEGKSLSNSL